MPEFLYVVRPTRAAMLSEGPTPEEAGVLAEHRDYVRRLAEEGVVDLAGRTQNTDDRAFGIVVFRAEDGPGARRIMDEDPAVLRGVMSAELFPYRVAFRGAAPGDAA